MKGLKIFLAILTLSLAVVSCEKSKVGPCGNHDNKAEQKAPENNTPAPAARSASATYETIEDSGDDNNIVGSGDDDRNGGDKKKKSQ